MARKCEYKLISSRAIAWAHYVIRNWFLKALVSVTSERTTGYQRLPESLQARLVSQNTKCGEPGTVPLQPKAPARSHDADFVVRQVAGENIFRFWQNRFVWQMDRRSGVRKGSRTAWSRLVGQSHETEFDELFSWCTAAKIINNSNLIF